MPGLVVNGEEILIPGIAEVEQINFLDEPKLKLKMGEDMRWRKTRWIRNVVAHNTKNLRTTVVPGKGPETKLEERISRWWAVDGRYAGAHLCIDWDGTVGCLCDLVQHAAYHAGRINDVSIGFELYEDSQGRVYAHQLKVAVLVTNFLTKLFQIQRQCPPSIDNRMLSRAYRGGRDLVGVFGHCHAYIGKPNDPGAHYFEYLEKAGYEVFNFWAEQDKHVWKFRQAKLDFAPLDCDGIPGPVTVDALHTMGCRGGVRRVIGEDWDPEVELQGDCIWEK